MKKRIVICNINIEVEVPKNSTEEEAREIASDCELPDNYVTNSFEIVKVVDELEDGSIKEVD